MSYVKELFRLTFFQKHLGFIANCNPPHEWYLKEKVASKTKRSHKVIFVHYVYSISTILSSILINRETEKKTMNFTLVLSLSILHSIPLEHGALFA